MTDGELMEFVTEFREGILDARSSDMMCFMVCAPLVTFLRMHGVNAEMVEIEHDGGNHVWLRLDDGRVLDPTADQFGLPPVYLGEPQPFHI